MFNKKKGFTLIELLVVIAIIGILATIVLVNLNAARNKAKDAAIKGALSEVRAAAEMEYDDALGSYAGVCVDEDVARIALNIKNNGGSDPLVCKDTPDEYCAESLLNTGGFWCVDYTGVSQYNGSTQCTADGAECTP